jgi:hypothetical protein
VASSPAGSNKPTTVPQEARGEPYQGRRWPAGRTLFRRVRVRGSVSERPATATGVTVRRGQKSTPTLPPDPTDPYVGGGGEGF